MIRMFHHLAELDSLLCQISHQSRQNRAGGNNQNQSTQVQEQVGHPVVMCSRCLTSLSFLPGVPAFLLSHCLEKFANWPRSQKHLALGNPLQIFLMRPRPTDRPPIVLFLDSSALRVGWMLRCPFGSSEESNRGSLCPN